MWNLLGSQLRSRVRQLIGGPAASVLAHRFVRDTPRALHRVSERPFDFPIPRAIRDSPILLIRVPRTSSVSLSMQVYGQVARIPHRTALFFRQSDPEFFDAVTKIAVVRDPWTRLLSAYHYLRSSGTDVSAPDAKTQRRMASMSSIEHFVYDYLEPNASKLNKLDPTTHSQHSYVCAQDGAIIVDRLFRFERIAEINGFLYAHGLGFMSHFNASGEPPSAGIRQLRPALIDAIGRIYATDVRLFDYAPPC